jgi:hypothetical protein
MSSQKILERFPVTIRYHPPEHLLIIFFSPLELDARKVNPLNNWTLSTISNDFSILNMFSNSSTFGQKTGRLNESIFSFSIIPP